MITYNHESYIKDSIESIMSQKCKFNFELIIGEDCSSDNTRLICKEYAEKYPSIITLICSDENIGMNKNFFRILKLCKGKYVAFCDGDDYWIDQYKLQKQVDFLEKNIDYGLCYSNVNCLLVKSDKIIYEKERYKLPNFDNLLLDNFIPTLTVCCRRNLIVDFYSKFELDLINSLLLDYPLWLYISYLTKIKYFNEKMGIYRILEESASHTKNHKQQYLFQLSILSNRLMIIEYFNLDIDNNYSFLMNNYSYFISSGNIKYIWKTFKCLFLKRKYIRFIWALSYLVFLNIPVLPIKISKIKASLKL